METRPSDLEARSRALYEESVAALDMRVQSRLTRARHAALRKAARRPRRLWLGLPRWAVPAGCAAALAIAAALWIAGPLGAPPPAPTGGAPSFADVDLVASTARGDADTLAMMQEDADFYTWAVAVAGQPDHGHAG